MATKITKKRMADAVASIMPMMISPAMVKVVLRNAEWTPEEIEEQTPAVIAAIAEEFLKRQ